MYTVFDNQGDIRCGAQEFKTVNKAIADYNAMGYDEAERDGEQEYPFVIRDEEGTIVHTFDMPLFDGDEDEMDFDI